MKKKARLLATKGLKISSSFLNIYFQPSGKYKTGFMASRKIAGAAKRVKTKRIIREFWRQQFKKGDFLFIFKPGIADISEEKLKKELEKAAYKIIKCGHY